MFSSNNLSFCLFNRTVFHITDSQAFTAREHFRSLYSTLSQNVCPLQERRFLRTASRQCIELRTKLQSLCNELLRLSKAQSSSGALLGSALKKQVCLRTSKRCTPKSKSPTLTPPIAYILENIISFLREQFYAVELLPYSLSTPYFPSRLFLSNAFGHCASLNVHKKH